MEKHTTTKNSIQEFWWAEKMYEAVDGGKSTYKLRKKGTKKFQSKVDSQPPLYNGHFLLSPRRPLWRG